jgi:hypothetical protein
MRLTKYALSVFFSAVGLFGHSSTHGIRLESVFEFDLGHFLHREWLETYPLSYQLRNSGVLNMIDGVARTGPDAFTIPSTPIYFDFPGLVLPKAAQIELLTPA